MPITDGAHDYTHFNSIILYLPYWIFILARLSPNATSTEMSSWWISPNPKSTPNANLNHSICSDFDCNPSNSIIMQTWTPTRNYTSNSFMSVIYVLSILTKSHQLLTHDQNFVFDFDSTELHFFKTLPTLVTTSTEHPPCQFCTDSKSIYTIRLLSLRRSKCKYNFANYYMCFIYIFNLRQKDVRKIY